jgi:P-type Ca2+ transporter type 2C
MEILIVVFLALFGSFILGELLSKFSLPKIIAPMFIGLIFGLKPFSNFFYGSIDLTLFDLIKDIALVFLLFFVGLKINVKAFKNLSKKSLYLGLFASLIPLIIGFFSVLILSYFFDFYNLIGNTNVLIIAFLVGVVFSVTAESVVIEILEEFGLIDSEMGQTILEAGIIDDILSIFLITIISTMLIDSNVSNLGLSLLFKIFQILIFSIILFLLTVSFVPKIMQFLEKKKSTTGFFTVSLTITFFLAMITQFFEIGDSVLGAILGGVVVNYALSKGDLYIQKQQKLMTEMIEVVTFGFFAPFFYIWIGFNVDLNVFIKYPYYILFLFLLLSFSKIFGSMVGNKFSKGTLKEGFLLGLAMNTKGGVEVMILSLALTASVITKDLFSLLICVSFLATIISPILFEKTLKKHHSIRYYFKKFKI